MPSNQESSKGFSLVEIIVVMILIVGMMAMILPNFLGMKHSKLYSEADGELQQLSRAVESYWRHNSYTFPSDVHSTLTGATPQLVKNVQDDPWTTDSSNSTYGYSTGTDSTFGAWFFIYTKGPKANTTPSWNTASDQVDYSGSGVVVSNAPTVLQ